MKEVRGCVGVGASKQLSMARVLFYTQWTNIWLNLDHPMYMDIDTLIWLTQQTLWYLVACNILDFHVLLTQQNTWSHFHQWVGKNIYILRNFLNNFIWRIPTLYTYMNFLCVCSRRNSMLRFSNWFLSRTLSEHEDEVFDWKT